MKHLVLVGVLTLLPGCPVLAPVVGMREPPSGNGRESCAPKPCSALRDAPPDTLDPTRVSGPEEHCTTFDRRSVGVTQSLAIDASSLSCVELELIVVPSPGSESTTITIDGPTLHDTHLHVTSLVALTQLRLAVHTIGDVDIQIDGAVRLATDGGTIARSTLELGGLAPTDAPEALFVDTSLTDVRITGARAAVRLRDASVSHAILETRSITLERGAMGETWLSADLVELLDVTTETTHLDVGRLIVTGGNMRHSWVARCDSAVLAATEIYESRFAACTEPLEGQRASLGEDVIEGDLVGMHSVITDSVIGGAHVEVDDGMFLRTSFCGTETLRASSLDCFRCEDTAPSDVCVLSFSHADACPGLCASTCTGGNAPAEIDPTYCGE